MSTDTPGGISGVGQPGFVARYGLAGPDRPYDVDEVAARIRELGLRTVRLAVVDQHGVPRGKMMSAEAAIAAMSDGLDFSGAIYSLDTGNQVFVPAFARGGGFGIAEFTGFPDVVVVPDPGTFRVLPWADRTGWMLCDVYFGNGQPVPLDGRGLLRRTLASLGEAGYDFLAGLEFEFSVVIRTPEQLAPENAGFTPPPPPVSVFERGYQFLSEVRLDSMGGTLEAIRDALYDDRPAAAVDRGRVGPGPARVQLRADGRAGRGRRGGAVPVGGQAGLPAARAAGHVHVPPGAAELLLLRLAPAPVAAVPG